ncbi:polyprenyl synthetase family protein [Rathayibacter soli]|uniref:polyprenyl synthetase family protein n=1 Tax=Rathayibacter soli TaxID=3144168 RepID=UPI0027E3D811|nr:polyprenyl synthetase family protein [Glaciibacter superstes]
MAESNRLAELVQARIDRFLDERTSILTSISDDLLPFCEFSRQFLSGGKRFRAQFCYRGWQSVHGANARLGTHDAAIGTAAALEMFHAAALVHDDIIDSSDTRRRAPSAHKRFEAMHEVLGYAGTAHDFGAASALLLGDLLLGWSDELLDEALGSLDRPERASAARSQFNRMRTEVTAGQYLDILEERAWNARAEDELLAHAHRVIIYKSAKYSVEAPLLIGATIAGASVAQRETLHEFGLPLGIAYQLRDDLLGVFGDAEVTGKPSGDDLREGKRTVLVAIARQKLPGSARRLVDELLGDPDLDSAQIATLQRTIRASGAVEDVERLIESNAEQANASLDEAPLDPAAIAQLRTLARSVTNRAA